jgi:plasmid maintenance system antidote protein VapI
MKKGEKVKDQTRNNRFIEAFDYLRRHTDVKTRIELAEKMGVSKDTVTRIMHAYTPFTDDAITKFQTASGCIFNLQWLRGESDTMLADVEKKTTSTPANPHQSAQMPMPDYSSLMNATISAQNATIASLKRELADKEESTKRELAAKEETISALRAQLRNKDLTISSKESVITTKNAQLADKDSLVESLKQHAADLRSNLAELRAALAKLQAKDALGNYPFPVALAEDRRQPSK